ncbi:MAG: TonB-dependent receptor, partial [Pseudomonadota bacterium]
YQFGDRDRLYVSFYNGRDVVATTEAPIGLDWGNATLTLRWNHLFSDRVFSNTSLIFSDYNYLFKLTAQNLDFTLSSGISNANFKQDFTFFLNEGNTIRTGLNTIAHSFKSGEFSVEGQGLDDVFAVGAKQALETGIYVGNDQQVGSRLRLNYGWRFSIFNLVGPATVYEFTPAGDPRDTLNYDALATYRTYAGLAPRFSAAWRVSETQSIKFAYARLFQYIHKLSNSSASLPTDYWVPTSEIVRPQRTDQFSLSYFHDLLGGKLQASAETFYKSMANQIDYRDGAALFFNDQFESQLVFGRGRTYGVEMLLRKPGGRWHGWLSYTILRSLRQFDDINGGAWYSARQDRIHDVAIVLGYDLNDHLELNLNWVFATGDAVTFPSGKYEIDGNTVTYYTGRNEYRFPPNHRLDLGLTWYPRTNEKFDHDLNFSVYNVYARQNPFLYQFRDNENAPGQLEVVRVALFSVVPSIAWNFRF